VPLVAWARHLAHLDAIPALQQTAEVLLAVYQEAFIHAEMPCLPKPTQGGGLPHAWEVGAAPAPQQQQVERHARTAGPMRFMVEFIGFVEIMLLRFGPSSILSSITVFVGELTGEGLAETAWYFQLLHFFGTITGHSAPWMKRVASSNDRLRLQVSGIATAWHEASGGAYRNTELHPSTWSLARWYQALHEAGFGKAFARALQDTLIPSRVSMRRPKWTATLLALMRVVWHNVVSVPSTTARASVRQTVVKTDTPHADILVFELVECGVIRFLMSDCIGSQLGDSLSFVQSSLAQNDRIAGLLDVRSAAITLLEDVTKSGRQHKVLVQDICSHVTRHFMDVQRSLLLSPTPRVRASAARLVRMLSGLRAPELDVMLQQSGITAEMKTVSVDDDYVPDHLLGSEETHISPHPLALHRRQIGELVGGFKGAKPNGVLYPPSTTVPTPRAASKPQTDVVVSRRSRSGSRGPR